MNKKIVAIIVAAIVIVSILAYHYWSTTNTPNTHKVTLTVSGAFALYPLMEMWASGYQNATPGVTIDVSAGGAGVGMANALSGLSNIGMVSREIAPNETAAGACAVAVVKDCVVATINNQNPVLRAILQKGVTKQMFYDIFIVGNVTTWGQVVGNASETTSKYQIHVFTRSDSCGAADIWAKYLGNKKQANLLGTGIYGDPGMLAVVQADPNAIGYDNLGYAYDMQTKLQVKGTVVVPIDLNGNGQIDQSENFYGNETQLANAILQGLYPSPPARNEYLVTKNQFTGETEKFVKWIMTTGQQYVDAAGYVRLPQDFLNAELANRTIFA
jgi:phosphate transport system substrate-binding protein